MEHKYSPFTYVQDTWPKVKGRLLAQIANQRLSQQQLSVFRRVNVVKMFLKVKAEVADSDPECSDWVYISQSAAL